MLNLDIQDWKEVMKTSTFQKYMVGTATCKNIQMTATKGCVQLKSNYTYFSDSWFSGVKTAEEAMAEGLYYFRPVKTNHKVFGIATLEKLIKYWPGGTYLFINSTQIVPGGTALLFIGYKYNCRKSLRFITT